VLLKGKDRVFGKYRDPIVTALAVPHDELATLEFHVLDPQAQPVHRPRSRFIEQAGHESPHSAHLLDQPTDFVAVSTTGSFLSLRALATSFQPGKAEPRAPGCKGRAAPNEPGFE
jgi:hypothetical protein